MAENLKIEVSMVDVQSGVVDTTLATKEELVDAVKSKADLIEGKVPVAQLPGFSEINGVSEAISGVETKLRNEVATALGNNNNGLESRIDTKLETKADLVNGRVPSSQSPAFKDVEGAKGALDGLKTALTNKYDQKVLELSEGKADLVDGKIQASQLPIDQIVTPLDFQLKSNELDTKFANLEDSVEAEKNAFITQAGNLIAGKANAVDVYDKAAVDNKLGGKVDVLRFESEVSKKAEKVDVDLALSGLSFANKTYATVAAANADIANIAINQSVWVSSAIEGGLYEKKIEGATSLTKSPYDPVNISKNTIAQITREQNSLRNYFTTDMFSGVDRSVASSGTIVYGDGFVTLPASTGFVLKRNLLAATTISAAVTIDEIVNPNIKIIRRLADNSILEINPNRSEAMGGKITLYFDAVSFLETDIQFSIYTYSRTHTVRNVSILNNSVAYVVKHDDNVNAKINLVKSELTTGYYQKEVTNDFHYPNLDNVNLYGDPAIVVDYPKFDGIDYFRVTKPVGAATGNTSFAGWSLPANKIPNNFRINLKDCLITQVANISTIIFRVKFVTTSGDVNQQVTFAKDATTGKFNGSNNFTKPENATSVRIYPSFTANSGYASDVSVSIPIGGLVLTDTDKANTVSSVIKASYAQDDFKNAVQEITGNTDVNIREIAYITSAFSDRISRGELIFKDGVLNDVNSDFNYISWWGSSSIAGMSPYLTTMATELGITNKYNGGKSGEIGQYHAARMGAIPAIISIPSGTIPASGKVEVAANNLPNIRYDAMGTFTGTLNGIIGTFGYDATSSTQLSFTRTTTGTAIAVGTSTFEFIPNFGGKNISGYVILNPCKNNILYTADLNESVDFLFDITMKMYAQVQNAFKRVIVINHYCNTNFNENQIEITKQFNKKLAKQFGNCLVDNNAYLLSEQVWIDTGFTKTQADIDAIARGVLPPTLSSDALHMNGTTVQALIRTQVKPKFQEIWF